MYIELTEGYDKYQKALLDLRGGGLAIVLLRESRQPSLRALIHGCHVAQHAFLAGDIRIRLPGFPRREGGKLRFRSVEDRMVRDDDVRACPGGYVSESAR